MNMNEEVASILGEAGYSVLQRFDPPFVAEFEDAGVFGFVVAYASVADLLTNWKADHDAFIRGRVQEIRGANEKRANLYAVFLTSDAGTPVEIRRAAALEENFVASRKITGVGVVSREQARRTLLPLIPLQASATIADADLDRRLEKWLQPRPGLFETLVSAKDADTLVKMLGGK